MITLPRALRTLFVGALAFAAVAAWSDDATIRKNWALHNPKGPGIDEITKTPIAGLYELRVDKEIIYSDEQGVYLIFPSRDQTDGHLLDARTKTDLTEQRLNKMMAADVPRLPFADALMIKQGNGSRRMIVFEDPNCHYCQDAERNFSALKDVTIYTFLIPILGPDSVAKSRQIWCSHDNAKAWRTWMLQGQMPPRQMGACDFAPLTRNLELANRYHLNYTPAIIFDDGSRFAGNADVDRLSKRLDEVAARKG